MNYGYFPLLRFWFYDTGKKNFIVFLDDRVGKGFIEEMKSELNVGGRVRFN